MQISDAEWIVMTLIWDGPPREAADVIERLAPAQGWTAATVKTMLHRLVRKGALVTQTHGKKYRYQSAIGRDDCVRRASRSFLDRVFGGDTATALLHFVKIAELSAREAAQIRALLDEKQAAASSITSNREGTPE